jgi:hypothetical protein
VIDVEERSRAGHGLDVPRGHSMEALCERELGLALVEPAGLSSWARRPLDPAQREAAALRAEALRELGGRNGGGRT